MFCSNYDFRVFSTSESLIYTSLCIAISWHYILYKSHNEPFSHITALFQYLSPSCSNPKAQLAALEHGAMQLLLRQVSYSHSEPLRKTALFALSALVRSNSKSQIVFLKFDGLETLMKLIQQDSSKRLKIKAVTLISDLVVEQNDVKQSMVKNGKMSESER